MAALALLPACTRSSVIAPEYSAEGSFLLSAGFADLDPTDRSRTYAVVWAGAEQGLAVRQPAGTASTAVDFLPHDARDVALTGKSSLLGSSLWVEVVRPTGGTGWVPSWNLSEDVPASRFCSDPTVERLRRNVEAALLARDGRALANLSSPKRGLVIRHDWWNEEVRVGPAQVERVFESPTPAVWGLQSGSTSPITGSFREIILPALDDVLLGSPEVACGRLVTGATGRPAQWPAEYAALNLLSYHSPAGPSETSFGWRTWAMVFEYLQGRPFLTGLVHYRGEIGP